MTSPIRREESEIDFKEPLSPTTPRTQSRAGSTHSLSRLSTIRGLTPPPVVKAAYGLMGSVGVVVSVFVFFADLATDAFLLFTRWSEVENEPNYYLKRKEKTMFQITLLLIVVPLLLINTVSLAWYFQNKHILGKHRLFYVKSKLQRTVCVLLHLLLLGNVARYFDILHYGGKIQKYYRPRPRAGGGGSRGSIPRPQGAGGGSRGSLHRLAPDAQEVDSRSLGIVTKDSALLDLMYNFLKNAPQLVFQMFLLYRTSYSFVEKSDSLTVLAQVLKLLIGLFSLSWSLVTFQDELRQGSPGKVHLSCGAAVSCLLWRACTVASRLVAIASIAALKIDGEGGLVKVYADNAPRGAILSFPAITSIVLAGHWLFMILWIHSQRTTFCHTDKGSRVFLEFFYNVCMGWVGTVCYVNLKSSPSRRRIIFFYSLTFVENTVFMVVWYLQLITQDVWLRVVVVFSVEALFFIGISCAVGYFAFLLPSHEKYTGGSDAPSDTRTESTWR